ncbi:hypothetical protein CYMTET_19153 [Cymbomonas tetramitiformis]|uniref:Uncharacterized protein n=1 Tax=Cymbomonas tetramitiformis TaxID=36881 RepID=A0AAE0G6T1_9CHLO|nr:hypothetical protein CYMTET_19153 [Cymbomonas tetramitiformis]
MLNGIGHAGTRNRGEDVFPELQSLAKAEGGSAGYERLNQDSVLRRHERLFHPVPRHTHNDDVEDSYPLQRRFWSTAWEVVLAMAACQGVLWVFHNPYCGLLFRCGCTWNWAGGWDGCNVHNPTGPHCPWCAAKKRVAWTVDNNTVAVLMLAAYFGLVFKQLDNVAPSMASKRLKGALIAFGVFLLHGFIAALVFKVATGYPHFIVKDVGKDFSWAH